MAHTTDVDGMLEAMTAEQWQEWQAKDLVEPIGHSTRVIGQIAMMLMSYFGGKEVSGETVRQICTPWLDGESEPVPGHSPQAYRNVATKIGI